MKSEKDSIFSKPSKLPNLISWKERKILVKALVKLSCFKVGREGYYMHCLKNV